MNLVDIWGIFWVIFYISSKWCQEVQVWKLVWNVWVLQIEHEIWTYCWHIWNFERGYNEVIQTLLCQHCWGNQNKFYCITKSPTEMRDKFRNHTLIMVLIINHSVLGLFVFIFTRRLIHSVNMTKHVMLCGMSCCLPPIRLLKSPRNISKCPNMITCVENRSVTRSTLKSR